MTHPLDFIIMGVGRSGTGSLAKAVNLHPDILCGVERFHYCTNPEAIDFPSSFEDTKFRCNAANLQRTLELMTAKGPDVAFVGDKNPRYFCNLDRWRSFKPDLRKIAIYRSPYEFLASWKKRADNPKDGWNKELYGAFGIYEMFGMLRFLLAYADDTLMVPYDAFYFGNERIVLDVVKHIGADPDRYPHERFRSQLFSGAPRPRPQLPDDVMEMLKVADIDAIDRILLRDNAYRIGDLRGPIEAYLQSVSPRLGELTERSLTSREGPGLHKLLLFWVRHFPQLQSVPNPDALPALFKLYGDLVHGNVGRKWYAAKALGERTNTNALVHMMVPRGRNMYGNPQKRSVIVEHARNAIRGWAQGGTAQRID